MTRAVTTPILPGRGCRVTCKAAELRVFPLVGSEGKQRKDRPTKTNSAGTRSRAIGKSVFSDGRAVGLPFHQDESNPRGGDVSIAIPSGQRRPRRCASSAVPCSRGAQPVREVRQTMLSQDSKVIGDYQSNSPPSFTDRPSRATDDCCAMYRWPHSIRRFAANVARRSVKIVAGTRARRSLRRPDVDGLRT